MRSGLHRFAGAAAVAVIVLLAGRSEAALVLDQSHMPDASGAGLNIANHVDYGLQTFTAGASGYIDRVDLNLRRGASATEPIVLAIWAVTGFNLDTKLAETALSPAAVMGILDYEWATFEFGLAAPQVTAGASLGLLLSSAANNFGGERYVWAKNDVYSAGSARLVFPNGGVLAYADSYHFKTYVDDEAPVPEPASLVLAATGLVIAARRRRA